MSTIIKNIASEKEKSKRLKLKRQELYKILVFNQIYSKIHNVQSVVVEFGLRWCKNLTTLNNLKGLYKPYNHSRKIIVFDELSVSGFTCETQAFRKVLGTTNFEIKRNRFSGILSYLIFK